MEEETNEDIKKQVEELKELLQNLIILNLEKISLMQQLQD